MDKIKQVLEKGVERIYPSKDALEKVLKSGKKIRLYCGYDPTAPSLHIGHAITLRKLAQFQELGHEVIFLLGDFTGMIGDPTDKTSARQKLTRAQVNKNLKNYEKQASKILKFSGKNSAKVMFNSKWNDKLGFMELVDLASNFTVQQMIVRDMYRERIKKNRPIYLHEFLYPLIQGYDSVAMDVDLEIGGKTQENVINLEINPKEMFGKIMAWPDSLIFPGFELCTDLSIDEINKIKKQKNNPRDNKARLAREIISIHHSKSAAQKAEREFNRVFKEKKTPSAVRTFKSSGKIGILDLLVKTKLAPSKSEAKRLVIQSAVKLDNRIIKDWKQKITSKKGAILKAGKRRFVKLI
ncbi:Tyrosine--tRNA ligase [subsurface metagenome]